MNEILQLYFFLKYQCLVNKQIQIQTPDRQGTPFRQATPDRQGTPDRQASPDRQGTPDRQASPGKQEISPIVFKPPPPAYSVVDPHPLPKFGDELDPPSRDRSRGRPSPDQPRVQGQPVAHHSRETRIKEVWTSDSTPSQRSRSPSVKRKHEEVDKSTSRERPGVDSHSETSTLDTPDASRCIRSPARKAVRLLGRFVWFWFRNLISIGVLKLIYNIISTYNLWLYNWIIWSVLICYWEKM